MNLFYLDQDLDRCAEYHVDKHIVKMQLEAAQLITTALWVDHALGYIPRALDKEERRVIDDEKATLKVLDARDRAISPYLPSFYNHPCSIYVDGFKCGLKRSIVDGGYHDWSHPSSNCRSSC